MVKILALDTATAACSVALLMGQQIEQQFELAPRRHAELILPMIQDLLAQAQCSLHQLDAIAFGCGPGSFMGVRTAAGIVQGLAFAHDLPVIPVSSLQAIAQTAIESVSAKTVLAGWDARMAQIYWGHYQVDALGIMQPLGVDQLADPKTLEVTLDQDFIAAGNAWTVYAEQLPPSLNVTEHLTLDIYPQAKAVAKIGAQKDPKTQWLEAVNALPEYVRDQVAWKKTPSK